MVMCHCGVAFNVQVGVHFFPRGRTYARSITTLWRRVPRAQTRTRRLALRGTWTADLRPWHFHGPHAAQRLSLHSVGENMRTQLSVNVSPNLRTFGAMGRALEVVGPGFVVCKDRHWIRETCGLHELAPGSSFFRMHQS